MAEIKEGKERNENERKRTKMNGNVSKTVR